jgi:hypothetical protein
MAGNEGKPPARGKASAGRGVARWFTVTERTVRAMRGPGESYSDVILRLVEIEAGALKLSVTITGAPCTSRRSCGGTASMDSGGEWCTYVQAAQRLHKSHGAIRQMALRGQLQRVRGNDGKARVLILPDMERAPHVQAEQMDERPSVQPERAEHVQRTNGALTHALESYIKTLQSENEALKQDLTTTRADLSAHIETLRGQLAGAEARAGEEAAKTAQAIAALQSLAERIETLAEARRPWWRRLVG